MIRACRFELVRLLIRRRWLVVVPAFALMAWLGVDNLAGPASLGARVNVWDGMLATFSNTPVYLTLGVTLFVFLVGDCVLADRSSPYAWVVLPRARSRSRWWTAKVAAVVLAALVYVLLGVFTTLSISALCLLPLEGRFSPYALGEGLPRLYGAVRPDAPAAFLPVFVLFTAFGLGSFALVPVVLTMWWPQSFLPTAFAAAAGVISYGLAVAYPPSVPWNPAWRLVYAIHLPRRDILGEEVTLTGSVLVFVAIFALAVIAGERRFRRMDM